MTKSVHSTVLITGASSGIGLELARLFAGDKYDLFLVARSGSQLERLAQELRSKHGGRVTVFVHDFANQFASQTLADQLAQRSIEIDVLVNNAGTQVYGEFVSASVEEQLAMMQVNMGALVHLTRLLLPDMIRRGRGRILNVGSTGSFAPGPLNAVYCASKAFVLSFSEAIGAELAGTGVTVTALCPGATNTPFITRHGMQDVRIFRNAMSPVRVAEIGYRALQHGQPLIVAGFGNQLQVLVFQLMAPFLGLTPPALLMFIGKVFMGRVSTKKPQLHQIYEAKKMSQSALNRVTTTATTDTNWKSLYKVGGAAALLAVLVALTDILLTFLPAGAEQPGTLTAVEWFELFQDNWFFGLRNLGLLPNILTLFLLIPVFLALYGIHRKINQPYATLALILSLVGTAIYLSNNAAFPMLTLSSKYSAATTEAERTLLAAAGEAILAHGEDFTPGVFTGFLFGEIAMVAISFVMLRGGIFSKTTSYTGMLGGICLTIFTIWSTFITVFFELAMILAMIGGLLSITWYILTARTLFQLSQPGVEAETKKTFMPLGNQ